VDVVGMLQREGRSSDKRGACHETGAAERIVLLLQLVDRVGELSGVIVQNIEP
jgi:hypothetical protein